MILRHGWMALLLCAAGGCTEGIAGRSRSLGDVDYVKAFAAGADVMRQHYRIESMNAESGVIKAEPKAVTAPGERLLGNSPAREVATLRLRREGNAVVAYASIVRQRMGGPILRTMNLRDEKYDTVPDSTPAQRDAATSEEQNASWVTDRNATDTERKVLAELYDAVHPKK